jgi:hypothetical protein
VSCCEQGALASAAVPQRVSGDWLGVCGACATCCSVRAVLKHDGS